MKLIRYLHEDEGGTSLILINKFYYHFYMQTTSREEVHKSKRRSFSILIIILEILILIMYGLFVRPHPTVTITDNQSYYPAYQDVNVMMLIGFGFLMTFIKNHALSALSYTFFINAIVVQIYILLSNFWMKVFQGGWEDQIIYVQQKSFTAASYAVAAQLIAFGGLLGKVGPYELLIMAVIGTVGYTLNQNIVYQQLHTIDAGGSTAIHTFGAYFGLTVSRILACKVKPKKSPEGSYMNSAIAMIGTLFLWMFWPSFNAGFFPTSSFQRSLIITNTILSLTGSCLGAFVVSALFRQKFSMEDILNATLAGGVIIGSVSGLALNSTASLAIGLIGGVISTFCFMKLTAFLEEKIGLNDTCGIHNLHGIPGILGGIFSAIVVAAHQAQSIDPTLQGKLPFFPFQDNERTLEGQAGIQIAATFISMGIGMGFGVITGAFLHIFYNFQSQQFYEDKHYFQVPDQQIVKIPVIERKKLPPLPQLNETYKGSQIILDTSINK